MIGRLCILLYYCRFNTKVLFMLQRPQSLCLLVLTFTMLTLAGVPIWAKIAPSTAQGYVLAAWYVQPLGPQGTPLPAVYWPYALVGTLAVVAAGLAVYEALRYDNRKLQLQLGALNALVLIVIVGLLLYFVLQQERQVLPEVAGKYRTGFLLPAFAIASHLLANYFIRKDEKLVNDSERMR